MKILSYSLMNNRVFISFIISFLGVLFSFLFLKPEIKEKKLIDKNPIIAFLEFSINEVQVKPQDQLLWKDIRTGDQLRKGDLIRTAHNSSAEVKFNNSDVSIKLGAETTITIEDKKGELELNMLEGDIFVAANSKKKVNLKSKDKIFDLSEGQVGFEVSDKGDLEVEVLSGELRTNDIKNKKITKNQKLVMTKKGSELKKNYFEFIKPEIGKNIYINPSDETVLFKWKEHKFNYNYKVFIGRTKSKMSEISIEDKTNSSIKAKIPAGIFYWQIKAIAKHFSFESSKIQSNFLAINPPVLLDPLSGERLFLEPGEVVQLKWSLGSVKDNAILEISKDEQFSKILESEIVTNRNIYKAKTTLVPGKYFWRIRGAVNEEFDEVISKVNDFTFKYVKGLVPPMLDFPANLKIFKNVGISDIQFSWKAPKKIKKFKLEITNRKDQTIIKDLEQTTFSHQFTKEGVYFWNVKSIDAEGNLSDTSKTYQFQIKKIPVLAFGDFERKVFYNASETHLNLNWEKVAEAEYYQVSFKHLSIGEKSFNSKTPDFSYRVAVLGEFEVKVKALKGSEVLSQSNSEFIRVVEHPLPNSPSWSDETKQKQKTDGFGNIKLSFNNIENAAYYLVEVRDLKSKIIKVIQSETGEVEIKSLYPGNYQLYVRSVDKFNRKSDMGDSLLIEVPAESSIKKPVLNKVQIR